MAQVAIRGDECGGNGGMALMAAAAAVVPPAVPASSAVQATQNESECPVSRTGCDENDDGAAQDVPPQARALGRPPAHAVLLR